MESKGMDWIRCEEINVSREKGDKVKGNIYIERRSW